MYLIRNRIMEIGSIMFSAYLILAILAASSTIARNLIVKPQPFFVDIAITSTRPERMKSMRALPPVWNTSVYYIPPEERETVAKMEFMKKAMQERVDSERKAATVGAPLEDNLSGADPIEEEDENGEPVRLLESSPPVEDTTVDKTKEEEAVGARMPSKAPVASSPWEPNAALFERQTPGGMETVMYLIRQFDQVQISVTGMVDFSTCWDWNTKAIYVTFIANYSTIATTSEMTFLDVVLKPPPPRRQLSGEIQAILAKRERGETLFNSEWQKFHTHLRSLRTIHSVEGALVDPYQQRIYLDKAFKYYVEDYDTGYLPYSTLEVTMRYQVMSYSGWAPVYQSSLGGRLRFEVLPYPEDDSYVN